MAISNGMARWIGAAVVALQCGFAWSALAQVDKAEVVAVRLSEFSYTPSELRLEQGHSYVLRLTNTGGVGHDFQAKAFFRAVALDADSAKRVHDGEVEVGKGETVDLALTPQAAGTFEVHCTHPLHSMLGMKGRIVVR